MRAARRAKRRARQARKPIVYPWLEVECSRCQMPRDVDLCILRHVPTTCFHDLAQRLICQKCRKGWEAPGSDASPVDATLA
jgi:hypothetical protein